MLSNIDIIVIIILLIVIVVIIGLNISSYIDRKISNICVNIPPIKIPQPNITVTINKDENKGETKTEGETTENFAVVSSNTHSSAGNPHSGAGNPHSGKNNEKAEQMDKSKIIKNTEENALYKNNQVSSNELLEDAKTNAISKQELEAQLKGKGYFIDETVPNTIKYSKENDNKVQCKNESIVDRITTGPKMLKQEVSCQNDYSEDPADYYKKKYHANIAFMDDPIAYGANYYEYSNYATPYSVGKNLIQKTRRLPLGYNYAFDDNNNKYYLNK